MTILNRGPVRMGQKMRLNIPKVEVGFTLCRNDQTGALMRGPTSVGTRTRLDIPVSCPPGSTFEGFYHTHPGGVAFPSQIDINSAKQFRAKVLCISNDSSTECFKFGQRRAA